MASEEYGGGAVTNGFALHCRGDVRLYRDGADCTPKSKKARALLAILAAEQRPLGRIKIIDLLWSDRQEEQARASLRTLLADLKIQFGDTFDDLLTVDRERVALGPHVRTDLTDPSLARPVGELFEGLDHIDPELDEWLRVERAKWAKAPPTGIAAPGLAKKIRRPRWELVAGLLLFIGTISALLYLRPWDAPKPPVVAVLKFKDLTGRNEILAGGLAEQLRIELAQDPSLGVIGRQSAESPEIQGKPIKAMAQVLGATHVIEGSLVPHEGQIRLSLRLYDDKGNPIWSSHLQATGQQLISSRLLLIPQIASLVGDVAARTPNDQAMRADPESWAKLFRARQLLTEYSLERTVEGRQLLFEIVSKHPNFVPALGLLTNTSLRMSDHPTYGLGTTPLPEARAEAIMFARRAVAAAPDYGPAHMALGLAFIDMPEAIPHHKRAVELNPGFGQSQFLWAEMLRENGDFDRSLDHYERAARLDPLHGPSQQGWAQTLFALNRVRDARQVMQAYFDRGVPAIRKWNMISTMETSYFGDWSRAFVAAHEGTRIAPGDFTSENMHLYPTVWLFGREAATVHVNKGSLSELILKDDVANIEQGLATVGPEFWKMGSETHAATHFLFNKARARTILAAYDLAVKNGRSPTEKDFINPEVVSALRMARRNADADRLVRAGAAILAKERGIVPQQRAFHRAWLAAFEGRNDEAIRNLQVAHRNRWWTISAIYDHPYNNTAFRGLRRDPRFVALVRDYDRMIERERREATAEMKAAGLPPPPSTPPPPAMVS